MDIDKLAEHALRFFEQFRRPGEPEDVHHWKHTARYPEWIYKMVYKVHENGKWGPDDYKYEFIVDALNSISEGADPEEGRFEIEPDAYYHQLYDWLASHNERAGYVDEAAKEWEHSKNGITGDIAMGQIKEKQEVWEIVVEALQNRLDDIEDDVPETPHDAKKGVKEWDPLT